MRYEKMSFNLAFCFFLLFSACIIFLQFVKLTFKFTSGVSKCNNPSNLTIHVEY